MGRGPHRLDLAPAWLKPRSPGSPHPRGHYSRGGPGSSALGVDLQELLEQAWPGLQTHFCWFSLVFLGFCVAAVSKAWGDVELPPLPSSRC